MPEDDAESCRLAFQAAMDLIQEKCGISLDTETIKKCVYHGAWLEFELASISLRVRNQEWKSAEDYLRTYAIPVLESGKAEGCITGDDFTRINKALLKALEKIEGKDLRQSESLIDSVRKTLRPPIF